MLSLGAIARMLRDWDRLQAMFRPATSAGYAVAVLALALAAVGALALVLTGVLFAAMCGQWLYAVRGWLRTPEGREQTGATDRPPSIAGQ